MLRSVIILIILLKARIKALPGLKCKKVKICKNSDKHAALQLKAAKSTSLLSGYIGFNEFDLIQAYHTLVELGFAGK